jgi:signal transduction histidine kinase
LTGRFDEHLEERFRIARDAHDSLLQTIQGSKMVADTASRETPDLERLLSAVNLLSEWLGRAIADSQAALASLQGPVEGSRGLVDALRRAGEKCRTNDSGATKFSFSFRGSFKEMHPIARGEVYWIGYEAIQHACFHSGGNRVFVVLECGRNFLLRVCDDGLNLDARTEISAKAGYIRLQEMHERASRMGGKLSFSRSQRKYNELRLVIPGKVIFTDPLWPR